MPVIIFLVWVYRCDGWSFAFCNKYPPCFVTVCSPEVMSYETSLLAKKKQIINPMLCLKTFVWSNHKSSKTSCSVSVVQEWFRVNMNSSKLIHEINLFKNHNHIANQIKSNYCMNLNRALLGYYPKSWTA